METATLTKAEESQIDRMSEGFAEPSMEERFKGWASRVVSEANKREKEEKKNHAPREAKGSSAEERAFIKAVGEKADFGTESPRETSAEKDSAPHSEQQMESKASEKKPSGESSDSPIEPISAERYWQRKLPEAELHDHWRQVDSRVGVAVRYITSHPQKEQIAQGLREFWGGKPAAWQQAFEPDLYTALAEVPNPGEVIRHIALKREDREVLRSVKNWQELRAAIQAVSKHYAAKAQPSPKPRAPKPPSEVGGKGYSPDDGPRGESNFSGFDRKQRALYAR